jgi:hypothetical protein
MKNVKIIITIKPLSQRAASAIFIKFVKKIKLLLLLQKLKVF